QFCLSASITYLFCNINQLNDISQARVRPYPLGAGRASTAIARFTADSMAACDAVTMLGCNTAQTRPPRAGGDLLYKETARAALP
ncbi:MAG TPA: hypothetical protein VHW95_00835, partial [Steroidobacteraceae bacterium]|nr:hypothetical protein [Steroidobacteraceae bacterium]